MNRRSLNLARARRLAGALAACALVGSAAASDQIPPPPQRRPLVISNAALHPVSGPVIVPGHMLVENGRIRAIGPMSEPLPAPTDGAPAEVIDLGGRHVYPGLISAQSGLGLREVGSVRATVDATEQGRLNPNARALVAVNADSELIPVARSNGVLLAAVTPLASRTGGIGGTSALVQLDGWNWADMAIVPDLALQVTVPRLVDPRADEDASLLPEAVVTEMRKRTQQALAEIDEAFTHAAAYARARSADPDQPLDVRWESMRDLWPAAGRGPATARAVHIHAQNQAQIRWALALAERHALRMVLVGGADAPAFASILAARDIPVIIAGTHALPLRQDDAVDARYRTAQALAEAGVRWCFASDGAGVDASYERNLPYVAAAAVPYGLPPEEALKGLTLYAAQVLGVEDQVGSLQPGRRADFIVTRGGPDGSGSPLQITTSVERLFIHGREVDAGNRQLRLQRKYEMRLEAVGRQP